MFNPKKDIKDFCKNVCSQAFVALSKQPNGPDLGKKTTERK
jgi:hypothetical protein